MNAWDSHISGFMKSMKYMRAPVASTRTPEGILEHMVLFRVMTSDEAIAICNCNYAMSILPIAYNNAVIPTILTPTTQVELFVAYNTC